MAITRDRRTLTDTQPNRALQPTYLPPLRYGKSAAELER